MLHELTFDHSEGILHSFSEIANYYNDTTPNDMGLSVIEGDTYLAYVPAKNLDLKIKKGDKMKPGILADIAMKEKRRIVHVYTIETSPFGVPYVANALPIIDRMGNSIGCIITTQSTHIHELIMSTSNQLSDSSQELLSKMGDLGKQAQELSDLGAQLLDISSQTVDIVKHLDDVLDLINSISSQTNLLGLNAAIEAARLGNAGKAFNVVADEIRNLARRSTNSITEVTEALDNIKQHNLKINQKSDDISKFVSYQVDTVNVATLSSQELTTMANELQQVANKMWNEK